jgi:hypothetical protein
MARRLVRNGIGSAVMFGVMTRPFKAHCWVQIEDVVLNDSLDHVRLFTPIKAVSC